MHFNVQLDVWHTLLLNSQIMIIYENLFKRTRLTFPAKFLKMDLAERKFTVPVFSSFWLDDVLKIINYKWLVDILKLSNREYK